VIPNILAERYASNDIKQIFDPINKIKLERRFWLEVLKIQEKFGLKIPQDSISKYEKNLENIDLNSIQNREKTTKHDVKARLDEFNSLAGYELLHLGLTSRDVTENVELIQIKSALIVVESKTNLVLQILRDLIVTHKNTYIVGRTHNVPAQITTLGKKFAAIAEEIMDAKEKLNWEISNLKFKGLKGAIGTQQDLLALFKEDSLRKIEEYLAKSFGFTEIYNSVGQIYPRSQDFSFISSIAILASGINNFALNIRILAGSDQVLEGFESEQVGSSAMPHKRNPRSSERINGLMTLLRGHVGIAAEISGNQWNEGDVSCSVVRRVIIPDTFFVIDAILNSFHSILKSLVIKVESIENELNAVAPFLASSKILMECVKKGISREIAHSTIKTLAIKSNNNGSEFLNKLSNTPQLELSTAELKAIAYNFKELCGSAETDCDTIIGRLNATIPNSIQVMEIGEKF
jgi:adenylosuccinate lyase